MKLSKLKDDDIIFVGSNLMTKEYYLSEYEQFKDLRLSEAVKRDVEFDCIKLFEYIAKNTESYEGFDVDFMEQVDNQDIDLMLQVLNNVLKKDEYLGFYYENGNEIINDIIV